jgi:hypothetical protein
MFLKMDHVDHLHHPSVVISVDVVTGLHRHLHKGSLSKVLGFSFNWPWAWESHILPNDLFFFYITL